MAFWKYGSGGWLVVQIQFRRRSLLLLKIGIFSIFAVSISPSWLLDHQKDFKIRIPSVSSVIRDRIENSLTVEQTIWLFLNWMAGGSSWKLSFKSVKPLPNYLSPLQASFWASASPRWHSFLKDDSLALTRAGKGHRYICVEIYLCRNNSLPPSEINT